MKIMIVGHGRHGKDTAAEMLREMFGFTFQSSSYFALNAFIYKEIGGDYQDLEECFADRLNRRQEWFEMICAYNTGDPARMTREIFESNDIYVGCRNINEFLAARDEGVFDLSLWVDASQRLPEESSASCTILPENAGIIIDNNGTLEQLRENLRSAIHAHMDKATSKSCSI